MALITSNDSAMPPNNFEDDEIHEIAPGASFSHDTTTPALVATTASATETPQSQLSSERSWTRDPSQETVALAPFPEELGEQFQQGAPQTESEKFSEGSVVSENTSNEESGQLAISELPPEQQTSFSTMAVRPYSPQREEFQQTLPKELSKSDDQQQEESQATSREVKEPRIPPDGREPSQGVEDREIPQSPSGGRGNGDGPPQKTPPQNPPNDQQPSPKADPHAKTKKILLKVGVPVAAGIVGVALAPVAITALGFTAGGIAAGSTGASMMSTAATSGVGMGIVSFLQSAGATGLNFAANAGIFAGGAAVAAAAQEGGEAIVEAASKGNGRNPTDQGASTKKTKTTDVGTNTTSEKADSDAKEEADVSDEKDNSVNVGACGSDGENVSSLMAGESIKVKNAMSGINTAEGVGDDNVEQKDIDTNTDSKLNDANDDKEDAIENNVNAENEASGRNADGDSNVVDYNVDKDQNSSSGDMERNSSNAK